MTDEERREARKSFESWSALTLEMIADGGLPGWPTEQERLRTMLVDGPDRRVVWMIFLAGFMSVEVD